MATDQLKRAYQNYWKGGGGGRPSEAGPSPCYSADKCQFVWQKTLTIPSFLVKCTLC